MDGSKATLTAVAKTANTTSRAAPTHLRLPPP